MSNVKTPSARQPKAPCTAELFPVRPFRMNFNFLNRLMDDEGVSKGKGKAVILRSVKNARLVENSERKNEEDYKDYANLLKLAKNGKLRGEVDLGSYFDGTNKTNLLQPFLMQGFSKRQEVKSLVKKAKRRPSKFQQQEKARKIKEMLLAKEQPQKHKKSHNSHQSQTPRLKIDLSRYLKKHQFIKRNNSINPKMTIIPHNPLSEPAQTPKGITVTVNNTPLSQCPGFTSQSVSEDSDDDIDRFYRTAQARTKTHREVLKQIQIEAKKALFNYPPDAYNSYISHRNARNKASTLKPNQQLTSNTASSLSPKSLTLKMIDMLQRSPTHKPTVQSKRRESVDDDYLPLGLTRFPSTGENFQQILNEHKVIPQSKQSTLDIQNQYELRKKEERLQASFLKEKFKSSTIAKWLSISQLQDFHAGSPSSRRRALLIS